MLRRKQLMRIKMIGMAVAVVVGYNNYGLDSFRLRIEPRACGDNSHKQNRIL